MRSLWLVAALLLASLPIAGQPPLGLQVLSVDFAHGPETWKEAVDLEDPIPGLGPWAASLGTYVDIHVALDGAGPWTATLSDEDTVVAGTLLEGPELIWRFDVDGQRALLDQPPTPPLNPGTWSLRIEAGTPGTPSGSAQAFIESGALYFGGLTIDDAPVAGLSVPEGLLPHVREVGPGDTVWMPLRPARDLVTMHIEGSEPHTMLTWTQWMMTPRGPDLLDPLAGTPGAIGATDLTGAWESKELLRSASLSDGSALVTISVAQSQGLSFISVVAETGGSAVFAVPASGLDAHIDGLNSPEPGDIGPVRIGIAGPQNNQGAAPLPGDLWVLRQAVAGTTTGHGGALLSQGVIAPDGRGHWTGVYDGGTTRLAGIPHVGLLTFFQDAFGNYATHLGAIRGVDATWHPTELGVGHPGTLALQLSNHPSESGRVDPALDIHIQLDVQFGDDALEGDDLTIPEGGAITRRWDVTPRTAGWNEATATIDSGDLLFTATEPHWAQTRDAFERDQSPWYSPKRLAPAPAAPLLLLGLGLLAVRKREI